MILNGTLIAQMVNFFVVLFIFDRLFLRKAVQIIQREQNEDEALMQDIQVQREKVMEREAKKKNEWEKFCIQFAQKIPAKRKAPSIKVFMEKGERKDKPTVYEITQYADTLEKIILQKVEQHGNA